MAVVSERAAFLRRFAPFGDLPDAELEEAAASARVEAFAAGATILAEDGQPAHALYVVRSGAVELRHDEETIDVLEPGEAFGHPSLLSGLAPAFDVLAREPTECRPPSARSPPGPGSCAARGRPPRRPPGSWPRRTCRASSSSSTATTGSSPTPTCAASSSPRAARCRRRWAS